MKKSLIEQLEKIHRLNYGNEVINEGFIDNIKNLLSGKKDEKKADEVKGDLADFYNTLEKSMNGNGISQEERGSMSFKKEVESLQIGLSLLGYELPRHGVDGLFGQETADALEKFKNDNKILNESASELRKTIKSLGYVEKGNEIDNGGPITNDISDAVSEILRRYKAEKPDVTIKVTGGNDIHHQNKKYSLHRIGNAVDMVINPYSTQNLDALIKVTKEVQKKYPKLTFIDEYRKPSSRATGPHFHVAYGKEGSASGVASKTKAITVATPAIIKKVISLLKSKNITSKDIQKFTNTALKGVSAKGQKLLNDPAFQQGLKEISDRIKISTKHIVKLMQHESKLDPTVVNNIGCVGLIQFCPDKGNTKEINGVRYNLDELKNNLPLQMKAIKDFWGTGYDNGKIRDAVDLYNYNLLPIAAGKPDNFVLKTEKLSAELIARKNPIFNSTLGIPKGTPLTVGTLRQYYQKVGMI